jgi:hypothetical protein
MQIIETRHPVDVIFGGRELTRRQRRILSMLPGYGSRVVVGKREVSMIDLAAFTAVTGVEFAMFTRGSKRLIVRGNEYRVPLSKRDITKLRDGGYRFSGHTHAGFTDADLISSNGDKYALKLFEQGNSAIYNALGRYSLIYPEGEQK